jgi:tripartite-type tricarboxylate transporter receptor subunit TctC
LVGQHPRRRFLSLAARAAVLPAARNAWAQTYPSRPVRIVVSAAPGSAPDILARLIGQWFSERLGQQFVTDNRPGGSNTIGTEAVVRAAPDGHTLLLVESSASINANLYEKLNYNFLRDIALVAGIIQLPLVIAVHPSFPARQRGVCAMPRPIRVGLTWVRQAWAPRCI